jgi:divalent metal cation (Fe/Co/Zn/Cd) transporter
MGTVLGMATGMPLPTLPVTISGRGDQEERQRLTRRARRLTKLGLAWHALEAAIAIAAGVSAGSVALVGFGADSVIEAGAGLVVLWLVTGERLSSRRAERRAQQLIAASFLMLSLYVTIESARDLIGGHHPGVSWVGVALAAVTLVAMRLWPRRSAESGPRLARQRRPARAGRRCSAPTSQPHCSWACSRTV